MNRRLPREPVPCAVRIRGSRCRPTLIGWARAWWQTQKLSNTCWVRSSYPLGMSAGFRPVLAVGIVMNLRDFQSKGTARPPLGEPARESTMATGRGREAKNGPIPAWLESGVEVLMLYSGTIAGQLVSEKQCRRPHLLRSYCRI